MELKTHSHRCQCGTVFDCYCPYPDDQTMICVCCEEDEYQERKKKIHLVTEAEDEDIKF